MATSIRPDTPTTTGEPPPMARDFVAALAARDFRGLHDLLAPQAQFRFLVPRGPGELVGAADIVAKFTAWFGARETVEVDDVSIGPVADRTSVRYRFRVLDAEGRKRIEQQAYLDYDEDGRIERIDLLCSGFRLAEAREATSAAAPGVHRFDAGAMSCGDGLADEFRRRIADIPVGDALAVTARDPAAREDLPPLARMLGHTVRAVERTADGATTFTIERMR
jgi:TusA-related sulfurtransferase